MIAVRWRKRKTCLSHALLRLLALFFLLVGLGGCGGGAAVKDAASSRPADQPDLSLLGHTIQVGAFSRVENAVRLMKLLDSKGLDAYYYRHESGLYKVRFGNFPSSEAANRRARELQEAGVIAEFYIVDPSDFVVADRRHYRDGVLRAQLVKTARQFLGVPYKWGGSSADDGFDCSGLTMTVYKMNGLDMPRCSLAQFSRGQPVTGRRLKPGDLVFFATNGGRKATHVGIYIGDDSFIHAPEEGKNIQTASLTSSYFRSTYIGGRSYLPDES